MLIDVHAHLFYENTYSDKDIRNMKLFAILNAGLDPSTNRIVRHMSELYPFVKSCYGYYPENIVRDDSKEIENEIKWIKENNPFAISEIGLDGTYDNLEKQKKYFKLMLNLAKELDKVAIIHTRKAEKEVIEILDSFNYNKIILHCFSGSKKLIEKAKDKYYFSIPANINRSQHFQMLASIVPLSHIFTETDSPFLSPIPNTVNNPNNVKQTLTKIAEIKGISTKEAEDAVFHNFLKLFKNEVRDTIIEQKEYKNNKHDTQ